MNDAFDAILYDLKRMNVSLTPDQTSLVLDLFEGLEHFRLERREIIRTALPIVMNNNPTLESFAANLKAVEKFGKLYQQKSIPLRTKPNLSQLIQEVIRLNRQNKDFRLDFIEHPAEGHYEGSIEVDRQAYEDSYTTSSYEAPLSSFVTDDRRWVVDKPAWKELRVIAVDN